MFELFDFQQINIVLLREASLGQAFQIYQKFKVARIKISLML